MSCVLTHTSTTGRVRGPLGIPGVVLVMDRVPWLQSPSKGLKGKGVPRLQSPMAGEDKNGGGGRHGEESKDGGGGSGVASVAGSGRLTRTNSLIDSLPAQP